MEILRGRQAFMTNPPSAYWVVVVVGRGVYSCTPVSDDRDLRAAGTRDQTREDGGWGLAPGKASGRNWSERWRRLPMIIPNPPLFWLHDLDHNQTACCCKAERPDRLSSQTRRGINVNHMVGQHHRGAANQNKLTQFPTQKSACT